MRHMQDRWMWDLAIGRRGWDMVSPILNRYQSSGDTRNSRNQSVWHRIVRSVTRPMVARDDDWRDASRHTKMANAVTVPVRVRAPVMRGALIRGVRRNGRGDAEREVLGPSKKREEN